MHRSVVRARFIDGDGNPLFCDPSRWRPSFCSPCSDLRRTVGDAARSKAQQVSGAGYGDKQVLVLTIVLRYLIMVLLRW